MEKLSNEVEQLIKNTAKRIFFVEGKLHATTQDIADAAGINRAGIHYYYRSRKILFDKVFEEAMGEFHGKLEAVLMQEELPFRQLVASLVDFLIKKSIEHPYLELFLVVEMNTNPELKRSLLPPEGPKDKKDLLKAYIGAEVAAGTMKPIDPEQFIINLISMCSFPSMAKPMVKAAIGLTEEEYQAFMGKRKDVILKQIFLDL